MMRALNDLLFMGVCSFQDGHHVNFATFNLQVARIFPIKFRVN